MQLAELPGIGLHRLFPLKGTFGFGVTIGERASGSGCSMPRAVQRHGLKPGATKGGDREQVQWSLYTHGNCS